MLWQKADNHSNELVIFDKVGKPRLFFSNKGDLITFRGNFVGFLRDNALYDYNGMQRGWFENGAMRDLYGNVVGFTPEVSDTLKPLLPLRRLVPRFPRVLIAPIRPITQVKRFKPLKTFIWSKKDPIKTFIWSKKDPISLFEVGKV